jgi:hypothetical protein
MNDRFDGIYNRLEKIEKGIEELKTWNVRIEERID